MCISFCLNLNKWIFCQEISICFCSFFPKIPQRWLAEIVHFREAHGGYTKKNETLKAIERKFPNTDLLHHRQLLFYCSPLLVPINSGSHREGRNIKPWLHIKLYDVATQ